jgi:hypothetical protein
VSLTRLRPIAELSFGSLRIGEVVDEEDASAYADSFSMA